MPGPEPGETTAVEPTVTAPARRPDPASVWPVESASPPACWVTSSTPPAATLKLRDEATEALGPTISVPAATVVGPV